MEIRRFPRLGTFSCFVLTVLQDHLADKMKEGVTFEEVLEVVNDLKIPEGLREINGSTIGKALFSMSACGLYLSQVGHRGRNAVYVAGPAFWNGGAPMPQPMKFVGAETGRWIAGGRDNVPKPPPPHKLLLQAIDLIEEAMEALTSEYKAIEKLTRIRAAMEE